MSSYTQRHFKSTNPSRTIPRDRVERAARIYSSNRDAGIALGIAAATFGRLCRRYGIDTPIQRRRGKGAS